MVKQMMLPSDQIEGVQYTFVEFDSVNNRLFLSVADQKYLGVYDTLNNYSFIAYLYFPDI